MNNDKLKKIVEFYKSAHNITLQISDLIEKEKFEESINLLEQRGIILKEAFDLRNNETFSELEKEDIKSILDKIKELDIKNNQKLQKDKIDNKKEFYKINKKQKVISAYKFNKEEIPPRIFDSKE